MTRFMLMANHDNGAVDTPMGEWAPEELAAHADYYEVRSRELTGRGVAIQQPVEVRQVMGQSGDEL